MTAVDDRANALGMSAIEQIARVSTLVNEAKAQHPQGAPVNLGRIQQEFQELIDINREIHTIIVQNPGISPTSGFPKSVNQNIQRLTVDIRGLQRRANPRDYEKLLRMANLAADLALKIMELVNSRQR